MICYPWYWDTVLQRLNKTYNIELLINTSCLTCYCHGELFFPFLLTAFAFMSIWPTLQRSYSMVILSMLICSLQKMMVRRVPAVERSCTKFRQDLCSELFTAFTPSMLSEHSQSQKDIKNCLLRIFSVQAHTPPHTAEPLPMQSIFLLAFGFFEKRLQSNFQGQGNGETAHRTR